MTVLSMIAAAVVLIHCACLAASINVRCWRGHPARFVGFAASMALLGAGAVGYALGWGPAAGLLLIGIAGRMLFDRRRVRQ